MVAYCNGCDKVVVVGEEKLDDTYILIKDTETEQIDHELVYQPATADKKPFDIQLTRSPYSLYMLHKEKGPGADGLRIFYIPSITASTIEIKWFEYRPGIDFSWNLDSAMFVADNPAGSVAILVRGTGLDDAGKYEIAQFEFTTGNGNSNSATGISDHLNYVDSFGLKSEQDSIKGIARAPSSQNFYAMAGWEWKTDKYALFHTTWNRDADGLTKDTQTRTEIVSAVDEQNKKMHLVFQEDSVFA